MEELGVGGVGGLVCVAMVVCGCVPHGRPNTEGAAAASRVVVSAVSSSVVPVPGRFPVRPGDRDGDGLKDEDDFCPDRAEDADDCDDEDGCPDLDNDGDGVLDVADACPLEHDRHSGRNGCPAPLPPNRVIVEETKCCAFFQAVLFRKDEAKIDKEGVAMLSAMAAYFGECPNALVVEILGQQSADEKDPDLSIRRAAAVRSELVARGVDSRKFKASVEKKRIWPEAAKQRRAEFKVLRNLTCARK